LEEDYELRKARLVRMGLLDSAVTKTPSLNKRKMGDDPMSLIRGDGNRDVIKVKEEASPAGTLAHEGMHVLQIILL
jgi:hypothetical protein